jgi:hypothetical protein
MHGDPRAASHSLHQKPLASWNFAAGLFDTCAEKLPLPQPDTFSTAKAKRQGRGRCRDGIEAESLLSRRLLLSSKRRSHAMQ